MNSKSTQWVSNSEMSKFCSDQGRTRGCGEVYVCTPQPETRGERRAGQKRPFMVGYYLDFFNAKAPTGHALTQVSQSLHASVKSSVALYMLMTVSNPLLAKVKKE
jgi:hypothetical protein